MTNKPKNPDRGIPPTPETAESQEQAAGNLTENSSAIREQVDTLLKHRELLIKYIDREGLKVPITNLAKNILTNGLEKTQVVNHLAYLGSMSSIGDFFKYLDKTVKNRAERETLKKCIVMILVKKYRKITPSSAEGEGHTAQNPRVGVSDSRQ